MKRQLEQQSRDLNERRRQFEDDKRLFEKEYQEWVDSQSASQHDLKTSHGLVQCTIVIFSDTVYTHTGVSQARKISASR